MEFLLNPMVWGLCCLFALVIDRFIYSFATAFILSALITHSLSFVGLLVVFAITIVVYFLKRNYFLFISTD